MTFCFCLNVKSTQSSNTLLTFDAHFTQVEMWLRSTFERAIDSFPFDTFIGALTVSATALAPSGLIASASVGAMNASVPSSLIDSSGQPLALAAADSSALFVSSLLNSYSAPFFTLHFQRF